jgi:serine/threonine protein kinase
MKLTIEDPEKIEKKKKTIEAQFGKCVELGSKSSYLVKLCDFFIEDNSCYFVMEYLPGINLEKLILAKTQISELVCKFVILLFCL